MAKYVFCIKAHVLECYPTSPSRPQAVTNLHNSCLTAWKSRNLFWVWICLLPNSSHWTLLRPIRKAEYADLLPQRSLSSPQMTSVALCTISVSFSPRCLGHRSHGRELYLRRWHDGRGGMMWEPLWLHAEPRELHHHGPPGVCPCFCNATTQT